MNTLKNEKQVVRPCTYEDIKFANPYDRLIEGYVLEIDNAQFVLFVLLEDPNHTYRDNPRGYFLKLMYGTGRVDGIDLDDSTRFPKANEIFNSFSKGLWINIGKKYKSYKYICYGHGEDNKNKALVAMNDILKTLS